MEMEMSLHDIKADIQNLEKRIGILEQKDAAITVQVENTMKSIDKNNELLENLNKTMQEMQIAMTSMIDRVERMNDGLNTVDKEVSILKEERNFNIMSYVKSNFIGIVTAIVFAFYVVTKN